MRSMVFGVTEYSEFAFVTVICKVLEKWKNV